MVEEIRSDMVDNFFLEIWQQFQKQPEYYEFRSA
jgi:hypothetical protein